MDYEEKKFKTNDLVLTYQEWGMSQGDKPTIITLHGFGVSGHMYDEFSRRYQDTARIINLDQRGHGDSEISEVGNYQRSAFVSDVEGLRIHLGLQNFILVGHSMAGIVIPKVAEKIPERLAHLVFLSAFILKDGESLLDNCPEEQQGLFGQLASESPDNTVMFPEEVFLEFFANGMDIDEAKKVYRKLTPTPYHPYIQKLDLKKFYSMDLPMSYIFCKQDKALPDGWWHPKMSSRIKHAYAEIDTCHEVMFSKPEACAEKIIQMAG